MELCRDMWAGAPICHLDMVEMLRKWVWTAGLKLAICLEPLGHRRNRASLNLNYRYYLVDTHLNWLN